MFIDGCSLEVLDLSLASDRNFAAISHRLHNSQRPVDNDESRDEDQDDDESASTKAKVRARDQKARVD